MSFDLFCAGLEKRKEFDSNIGKKDIYLLGDLGQMTFFVCKKL